MKDFDDLGSALHWHDSLGRLKRAVLDWWHAPLWPFSVKRRTFHSATLNRPVPENGQCGLCDGTGKILVAQHNDLMYPCNQILNLPGTEKTFCFRCNGQGKMNWSGE